MLKRGDHILMKVAKEGIYLNEQKLVKAENISIGLIPHRNYQLKYRGGWIKVLIMRNIDGALDCDIITVDPGQPMSFTEHNIGESEIERLLLTWFDLRKLEAYFAGGREMNDPAFKYDWGRKRNTAFTRGFRDQQAFVLQPYPAASKASIRTSTPGKRQEFQELPVVEYKQTFKLRFDDMQIVNGAALFSTEFLIPNSYQSVHLELRVENGFLRSEFDSIKGYFSNVLKRKTVEVAAMIRCRGSEIESVKASSPVVSAITSDLLDEVRYYHIKRELKEIEEDAGLVTVDELFEKVKESGLQPSDRQFVEDVIAAKKLKHAKQVRHLSDMHLHDLMKLKIQTKPFAFVCLVRGIQGLFVALETPDKVDATYLWKLEVTEEEIRSNESDIPEAFTEVEKEISLICDIGRERYRKNKPDNFTFIHHDNKSDDGFITWKDRLHRILDGEQGY